MEVSLRSLLGLSKKGTMKLRGTINKRKVIILINCGATYNLINKKIFDGLQLPLLKTSKYGVIIGNGKEIQGNGDCQAMMVQLPGLEVRTDLLPIGLGKMDVILGRQCYVPQDLWESTSPR